MQVESEGASRCALQPLPSDGSQERNDEKEVGTDQENRRTLGRDLTGSKEMWCVPHEVLHGKWNIAVQSDFPPECFRLRLELSP